MRSVVPVLLVVTSIATQACADAGAGESDFVVTIDSAGVTHAANRGRGAWSDSVAWHIEAPHIRIGRVEGNSADVFGRIADVAVGADGRVYVLDWQARDVRVFAADGTFLDRFGRPGEGPGEFQWPDALVITPTGNIAVRDSRLFRITLFSPDGVYLRDFRIRRPYPAPSFGDGFWVDAAGRFHDRFSATLRIDSADSLAVARYAADGEPLDTLLLAETRQSIVPVIEGGIPRAGLPIPYAPVPVLAVNGDGSIARALGASYRIDIVDAENTLVRVITRDVQPERVREAERDSIVANMRVRANELAEGGVLEEGFALPEHKPAITHLLADAAGHWWVAAMTVPPRFEPPSPFPASFDVFNAEGRFLGTVDAPFRITEIGNSHVAGIVDDSLGVSYAVVARLTKGTARSDTR